MSDKDTDVFHTTMVIANEEDWRKHVDDVKRSDEGKGIDGLLDEIFDFDFKFDFI